ncbi:MAG: TolC family protein, partial [Bacteroidota bacterium]
MTHATPWFTIFHKVKYLLMAGGLCLCLATSLQAQPLLTLEEAVQMALKNNTDIRIAQGTQKIAAKNYHLGNAGFLPKLDAQLRGDRSHPIATTGRILTSLSPDVCLTWNIFNGLQSLYTYQNLGTLYQISQLNTQQTTTQQIAAIIKHYYALVLAQQKAQVLENALTIAKKALEHAQAQYQAGTGTQLDYLTAQVQYNTEQAQVLAHQEALTTAKMALQQLLGENAPQEFTVTDTIPLAEKLTWDTLEGTWAAANVALRTAQQQR